MVHQELWQPRRVQTLLGIQMEAISSLFWAIQTRQDLQRHSRCRSLENYFQAPHFANSIVKFLTQICETDVPV